MHTGRKLEKSIKNLKKKRKDHQGSKNSWKKTAESSKQATDQLAMKETREDTGENRGTGPLVTSAITLPWNAASQKLVENFDLGTCVLQ